MATNTKKANKTSATSSQTEQHDCIICGKPIKDNVKGHESIFCEGECQGWMHRTCAGLSTVAFQAAVESSAPYLCHYCASVTQQNEIKQLREMVDVLKAEIESIKHKTKSSEVINSNPPPGEQRKVTYASLVNSGQPTNTSATPISAIPKSSNTQDRRFNLVVYGVDECAKGTPRYMRSAQDTSTAADVLASINDKLSEHSIRDCQRLGKYCETKKRPLLVKLTRSCDVTSILSKRSKLVDRPGLSIKPDMTKEERKIQSILLQERRKLIQSGESSQHVKLRGNSLYLNKRKHGSVINSKYVATTTEATQEFGTNNGNNSP